MGADLIVAVLEFPKGKKQPKWSAAKALLEKLTDKQLQNAYCDSTCCDDLDDVPDIKELRNRVLTAFEDVKAGWEGNMRTMVRLNGVKTTMLIAGDTSWGDSVESVDAVCLFAETGLAKAAGFLVK